MRSTTLRAVKSGPRRWWRVFVFVAFVTIVTAAGFECAVRALRHVNRDLRRLLYIPRIAPDYHEARDLEELLDRSLIGFRPYSNFAGFLLNSRGFVTPEYADTKQAGSLRVVALGDSFTQKAGGIDFERQWTTLLQHELEKGLGSPAEVINLGVCAVGPRFEQRVWELEGRRLSPDFVVLGLFVGNDFTDEDGSLLAGIAPREGTSELEEWWLRHSLAFRFVRNWRLLNAGHLESLAEQKQHLSAPPPPTTDSSGPHSTDIVDAPRGGFEVPSYREMFDDTKPTFDPKTYDAMESWLMSLNLRKNRDGFLRTFDAVSRIVGELHQDVKQHGGRLLVVVIPDEYQVDPQVRADAMAVAGTRDDDYDLEQPQRELAAFFAKNGIESLDLLAVFRERAKTERLYRPRDSHWNVAGNRLAAETIGRFILERRRGG